MDKKYISRFFYFSFDFDFNHDFDTNRHALSHILLVFAHLTCLAHRDGYRNSVFNRSRG